MKQVKFALEHPECTQLLLVNIGLLLCIKSFDKCRQSTGFERSRRKLL